LKDKRHSNLDGMRNRALQACATPPNETAMHLIIV
jgi:hypothetical protein